jgi:hypothetical protein
MHQSLLRLTKRWGKANRKFATMWIYWLRRLLMWRRKRRVLEWRLRISLRPQPGLVKRMMDEVKRYVAQFVWRLSRPWVRAVQQDLQLEE